MPVTDFLVWVLQGFWRTIGLIFLVAAAATWSPVTVKLGRGRGEDE